MDSLWSGPSFFHKFTVISHDIKKGRMSPWRVSVKGQRPFLFLPFWVLHFFVSWIFGWFRLPSKKRTKEQEGTAVHRPEEEKKQDDTLDCHWLIRIVESGGIPHDTQLSTFRYVDDKRQQQRQLKIYKIKAEKAIHTEIEREQKKLRVGRGRRDVLLRRTEKTSYTWKYNISPFVCLSQLHREQKERRETHVHGHFDLSRSDISRGKKYTVRTHAGVTVGTYVQGGGKWGKEGELLTQRRHLFLASGGYVYFCPIESNASRSAAQVLANSRQRQRNIRNK